MEQYYLFFSFCAGVIATLLVDVITMTSSKKPGKPADKPKQGDMHGYYVERLPQSQGGEICLKNNEGACLGIVSVYYALGSSMFKSREPELVPILEKAKAMMAAGEEGPVVL